MFLIDPNINCQSENGEITENFDNYYYGVSSWESGSLAFHLPHDMFSDSLLINSFLYILSYK